MAKRKIGLIVLLMGFVTAFAYGATTSSHSDSVFCKTTRQHYFNALTQFGDAAQTAANQISSANIPDLKHLQDLLANAHSQIASGKVSSQPSVKALWDGISSYPVNKKYKTYVKSLLRPLGEQMNSMETEVNKWKNSAANGGESCRTNLSCDLGEAGHPNCDNSN